MKNERRAKGLYWDRAWKLVEGCTKVSPGCDNCWSEHETAMRAGHPNAKIRDRAEAVISISGLRFHGNVVCREGNLDLPLRTKKPTVWAIWNDLYHEDVPDDFRDRAYAVMALCPQHTFLVLTKRAERMAEYWNGPFTGDGVLARIADQAKDISERTRALPSVDVFYIAPVGPGAEFGYRWFVVTKALGNVWHGVTCEDQKAADERIPHLLRVPGKRFLSIEPMLGPVDLMNLERPFDFHRSPYGWPQWLGRNLHQVILGGESGKNARPMDYDWARSVRDHCAAAGASFFFKQDSGSRPNKLPLLDGVRHDALALDRAGVEDRNDTTEAK